MVILRLGNAARRKRPRAPVPRRPSDRTPDCAGRPAVRWTISTAGRSAGWRTRGPAGRLAAWRTGCLTHWTIDGPAAWRTLVQSLDDRRTGCLKDWTIDGPAAWRTGRSTDRAGERNFRAPTVLARRSCPARLPGTRPANACHTTPCSLPGRLRPGRLIHPHRLHRRHRLRRLPGCPAARPTDRSQPRRGAGGAGGRARAREAGGSSPSTPPNPSNKKRKKEKKIVAGSR